MEAEEDPHLTTNELARRWRCTKRTVRRRARSWGLRPLLIAGRLLFPTDQVSDAERRAMKGELASE
jgi:hypothetical protein